MNYVSKQNGKVLKKMLKLSYWFALIETVKTVFLRSNVRIRFPTKTIYAIHSKLSQISD